MLSIGSQTSNPYALPDKSLERQKAKQMTEDIKLATIKTTEVRQSYGNLSFTPGSPGRLVGATEELPNFRRSDFLFVSMLQILVSTKFFQKKSQC